MGDMSGDAFREGHPDYNRGHLIDPNSIEYGDVEVCTEAENGKHRLEHWGQVDPQDIMSNPIVHCKRCGFVFLAKWKKEYREPAST